jgi:phosphatidylglycerophosphate synthase
MAFNGHKKEGKAIFNDLEKIIVNKFVSRVPKFIETYHLTYMTILWSLGVILFSFLAKWDVNWLWLVSLMIVFQYITDLFDGAVGRFRNTGLVKWGYYMDHFLDYLFLCSILIGYSFILPDRFKYILFFILALFGGFMVSTFLSFAATNQFRIAHLGVGPTEIRLIFIIINTLLILFGKTHMAMALPYVLVFSLLGLIVVVYQSQKQIWDLDMKIKKKEK